MYTKSHVISKTVQQLHAVVGIYPGPAHPSTTQSPTLSASLPAFHIRRRCRRRRRGKTP